MSKQEDKRENAICKWWEMEIERNAIKNNLIMKMTCSSRNKYTPSAIITPRLFLNFEALWVFSATCLAVLSCCKLNTAATASLQTCRAAARAASVATLVLCFKDDGRAAVTSNFSSGYDETNCLWKHIRFGNSWSSTAEWADSLLCRSHTRARTHKQSGGDGYLRSDGLPLQGDSINI